MNNFFKNKMCRNISKGCIWVKNHKLRFLHFLKWQCFSIEMIVNEYFLASYSKVSTIRSDALEKYSSEEKKRFKIRPYIKIGCKIPYAAKMWIFIHLIHYFVKKWQTAWKRYRYMSMHLLKKNEFDFYHFFMFFNLTDL